MLDCTASPALRASVNISSKDKPGVFWRTAAWCSDGSAIVASREDRSLQVWNLGAGPSELKTSTILSQPAPVQDVAWFPWSRTLDPVFYCFVASVRGCPVKLLDASSGQLRASYRIVDHRERFVAPTSMAFNCAGNKLFCGFQDAIEVFDVQTPGDGTRLLLSPCKRSKSGLKGIVSSLSFSLDHSGIYAAATFSSSAALFAESSGAEMLCSLKGITAPVTQVKFNPNNANYVYACTRRTGLIHSWDIRNPKIVLATYRRKQESNQRQFIDIDPSGSWLSAGDADGNVCFFDLSSDPDMNELEPPKFPAHSDVVGAAVFHPTQPMLLTVAGSRHFQGDVADDSDSDYSIGSGGEEHLPAPHVPTRPLALDASMKIWDIPCAVQYDEMEHPAAAAATTHENASTNSFAVHPP